MKSIYNIDEHHMSEGSENAKKAFERRHADPVIKAGIERRRDEILRTARERQQNNNPVVFTGGMNLLVSEGIRSGQAPKHVIDLAKSLLTPEQLLAVDNRIKEYKSYKTPK